MDRVSNGKHCVLSSGYIHPVLYISQIPEQNEHEEHSCEHSLRWRPALKPRALNPGELSSTQTLGLTLFCCHTIRVVISPKGLATPPAFDATTTLTHARGIKSWWSRPTAVITAPIKSAVVRLSARGDMQNARPPATAGNTGLV